MILKNLFKIGFWSWQVIIVLILSILSCSNAHIMRHEYTSDSLYMMMEMGEKAFWIDYYLYETLCFGTFPALLIVVANVLYRSLVKKLGDSNGNQSIIIEVLKYLGVLCGVFVLVIGWLVFAIVAMPLHVIITVMIVLLILYLLLRKEHWLLWICTILLFMVTEIYYVFNNDLPGPMMWSIADRPIDAPSQWFNNYRFLWWGVIINKTFQFAGLISFGIIAIFKLTKMAIKKWTS